MKAMILAAGRGERMLPLTQDVPKPMLLVHGMPLIEHKVLALKASGFTDIVINIHYLGEQIVAHLGNGEKLGVKITYSKELVLLETAGGIRNALPLLGQDPFLVVPADTMMDMDFAQLTSLPKGSDAHLVMVDNPDHHPDGDYGIDANGKLSFEGPKLTYSSVALFSPQYFSLPELGPQRIDPQRVDPQRLRDLFETSILNGRVSAEYFGGFWADIGTPERLQEINAND